MLSFEIAQARGAKKWLVLGSRGETTAVVRDLLWHFQCDLPPYVRVFGRKSQLHCGKFVCRASETMEDPKATAVILTDGQCPPRVVLESAWMFAGFSYLATLEEVARAWEVAVFTRPSKPGIARVRKLFGTGCAEQLERFRFDSPGLVMDRRGGQQQFFRYQLQLGRNFYVHADCSCRLLCDGGEKLAAILVAWLPTDMACLVARLLHSDQHECCMT